MIEQNQGKVRKKRYREYLGDLASGSPLENAFWDFISRPEKLVIIFMLFFGLQLVFYTPPFQVCDEHQHLANSYRISEAHIFPYEEGGIAGSYVPISFKKVARVTDQQHVKNNLENKPPVGSISKALKIPLNPGETTFLRSYFQYPALCYLPQAVGILVGRLFGLSALWVLYLARMFNLLALVLVGYITVRMTPILKWTFFFLFLMPMAIFQFSSASADALTIGFSFLATAFFLRLALDPEKEKLERKDYYLLGVMGLLLGMLKPPYCLLVFMFFLIPWRRFGSFKKYLLTFVILFLGVIIIAGTWQLVAASHTTVMLNFKPVDQIAWVLRHPRSFLVLMHKTFSHEKYYLSSLVAGLGWCNIKPPVWLVYGFLFTVIAVTALDKDEIEAKRWQRLYSLALFLAMVVIVTIALFATANQVGVPGLQGKGEFIWGITGRYYIPPLALFFFAFYNRSIKYEKSRFFYLVVSILGLASAAAAVNLVVRRFY